MSGGKATAPDDVPDAPTGWQVIAGSEAMVAIVDALLNLPEHREFNKKELAEFADVSRKSVHTHFDVLLQVDLIKEVPNTNPTRYQLNLESEVAELLVRLDGAINRAGPYAE
jgi:hypothetical protein